MSEEIQNIIEHWKKGDYVLVYSFNYDRAGKKNDEILKYIEKQDKEIERLNNIINELENYIRARADDNYTCSVCSVMTDDLLNILKGSESND